MKGFKHSKYFKTAALILGLIALFITVVWGRAFYGSIQAYQKGKAFQEKGQYIRAVTFFDRAIHWYTPFNPYVRKSAEGLWEIGEQAEKQGDIKLALIAFRTIRSGFYGARHFTTPGKGWIKKSEQKISALMETEEKGEDVAGDSASLREDLFQDQKSTSPKIFWTIILEVGFLGWIGSVIGFIMFSLRKEREGKTPASSKLLWMVPALVFFILWIIGMMKA